MTLTQWAFWLAAVALLAGVGKFLDEYHVNKATKSKMRDALVRWFLWLEARAVPDLGGVLLRFLAEFLTARVALVRLIALAVVFVATITAFYLGRGVFGPPVIESYFDYLVNWIPRSRLAGFWLGFLALIIIPSFLGLIVTAQWVQRASRAETDLRRLGLLVLGLFIGSIIAFSGAWILLYTIGPGGYMQALIYWGSLSATIFPLLLLAVVGALVTIRLLLRSAQYLSLHVFDAASSPAVSPFTYFSALAGIILLAAKVLQSLVSEQP